MTITKLQKLSIIPLAGLAACTSKSDSDSPQEKPNIVIVLVDDMGYSDIGCFGGEIETPVIDQMAENGIRYNNFCNTGRSWPSRSSLMTGYYAQAIRMDPNKKRPSPDWAFTIPDYLKPLGYRCYHSGKWHFAIKNSPFDQGGFDHSYNSWEYNDNFAWEKHTLDDEKIPPIDISEGKYSTTVYTDYAIDFLKEHKQNHADNPFFLYLAYITPHFPVQALQKDIDKYRDKYLDGWDEMRKERHARMQELGIIENTALSPREPDVNVTYEWFMDDEVLLDSLGPGEELYPLAWESLTDEQKEFQATKMAIHAAMVDRNDQEVGRLMQQIKDMGEYENTIVFFLSDNGASAEIMIRGGGHDSEAPLGSQKSYVCLGPGFANACNTPFRRFKKWNHEGGIATPLVVHWPNGIKDKGVIRKEPGHIVDLLPTALELAGGKYEPVKDSVDVPEFHGKSLVSSFEKDHVGNHDFLFFKHEGNRALKMGKWKIVSEKIDNDKWYLYDMSVDRAEQNDLSEKHPEKFQKMIAFWEAKDKEYEEMSAMKDETEERKK